MRRKKFFQRYQQNAVKTKFSPLPAECDEKKIFTAKIAILTNIHRANFIAYLKFTANIFEVSDRWRSGIRSCWLARGQRFETCTAVSFFVRNPVNAVKKIFSPLKTAKTHRIQRYKMRALCGENFFFHRYSPLILYYFLTKLDPNRKEGSRSKGPGYPGCSPLAFPGSRNQKLGPESNFGSEH